MRGGRYCEPSALSATTVVLPSLEFFGLMVEGGTRIPDCYVVVVGVLLSWPSSCDLLSPTGSIHIRE